MNVLKKCCYRSLKENRKRTLVTIVGIILATALITAVACMLVSFRASMVAYEKKENGDFHYLFSGVSNENLKYFQNNKNIEKMGLLEEVGYALLEESQNPDKPYLYIRAADKAGIEAMSLQLTEGRMPENDRELVIGRHIQTNGLAEYHVGDVVTFSIGSRVYEGRELGQNANFAYEKESLVPVTEKTYTIVGIVERPSDKVEDRMAPGYSAFTWMEEAAPGKSYEVYATYTDWGLRHATQVTAGILGVSEELYKRYYSGMGMYSEEEKQQLQTVAKSVVENYWLLKWEILIFSASSMSMIYAMSAVAILVIILTSVFCIRNSFMISLTEKMKLYGRLSSVGTTAGQQKKMVYSEALILGGIGIPLGMISGVAASAVLVRVVSGLVEDAMDIPLVFGVSFSAVLFGAVLAVVTVFFSAAKSARLAAKISPISAIRANDMVKMNGKALGCPKWVNGCFGIGGKVAYKNLKRAKIKYRTTVISIVVSVAAFIGLTTFMRLLIYASTFYYENQEYQLRVALWKSSEDCYEEALQIAALEGVEEAEICRTRRILVDVGQIPFTKEYLEIDEAEQGGEGDYIISVMSLGEEGFARYCQRLGVSVEDAEKKAILLAEYEFEEQSGGKIYSSAGSIADYHPGDVIQGRLWYFPEEGVEAEIEPEIEIEVLLQTKEKPMCMSGAVYNDIRLIVSDAWMEEWPSDSGYTTEVYMKCEDADKVEQIIRRDLQLRTYTISNYEAQYRSDKSMNLAVSIFLYGFITVVALIGITNIFNTVTTNMELRAPEFAMLRSVGMTGREFRRMVWLEGVFYGGKALLVGIPIGVFISYCFYKALGQGIVTAFRFPVTGIVISVAAVIVLLYVIMHYSMGKINRKNIIETIQNENI